MLEMVRLTREVRLSIDREGSGAVDRALPVTNAWSGWPRAVGLAPFVPLRITVAGAARPDTGYLCSISDLDRIIRTHGLPLMIQCLAAGGSAAAPAALVAALWERLAPALPAGVALARMELPATPYLRYAIDVENPAMVQVTQQFEFSAAHRLHCPSLSDEENRQLFGKCNHASGHGHNYLVDVTVAGRVDARTGALISPAALERTVRERVIDRFDHRHLNVDLPEFRECNPSVENIAAEVFRLLEGAFGEARLERVRVYETPKTWAEVTRG